MLVLTRKKEQSVMIKVPKTDKEVVITIDIKQVKDGKTKLGFDAPDSVRILRDDIKKERPSGKQ